MKVKQLIAMLKKADPNATVVLQKDSEGNGYSPCCGAESAVYVPENTYSGTVYSLSYSADDNCMEEDEWEKLKESNKNKCVVLWPVN